MAFSFVNEHIHTYNTTLLMKIKKRDLYLLKYRNLFSQKLYRMEQTDMSIKILFL